MTHVRPAEFLALMRSGEFEQLSAMALLVLAEWTLGPRVVESASEGHK